MDRNWRKKKDIPLLALSLALAALLSAFAPRLPFLKPLHWKIYDRLLKIKKQYTPLPAQTSDIVLVTIDNNTITQMPHCWPYPRVDFAKVIENLNKAHPKAIALDFAFFGASPNNIDDALLVNSLNHAKKIILANNINDDGMLDLQMTEALNKKIPAGIVTKIEDQDGIIRRNLTYVLQTDKDKVGFLSWEMQILKETKDIDPATISADRESVSFSSRYSEEWDIPVGPSTNSFLINFRANTMDFKYISFYRILRGDFDPNLVRNKIVLVGFASSMLGDIHQTPLGWLPGLTINANAFLNLYAHDFLRSVPKPVSLTVLFIGIMMASELLLRRKTKNAFWEILALVFAFFLLSYWLMTRGYIWNYSLFPIAVLSCPLLAKKIVFFKRKRRNSLS